MMLSRIYHMILNIQKKMKTGSRNRRTGAKAGDYDKRKRISNVRSTAFSLLSLLMSALAACSANSFSVPFQIPLLFFAVLLLALMIQRNIVPVNPYNINKVDNSPLILLTSFEHPVIMYKSAALCGRVFYEKKKKTDRCYRLRG